MLRPKTFAGYRVALREFRFSSAIIEELLSLVDDPDRLRPLYLHLRGLRVAVDRDMEATISEKRVYGGGRVAIDGIPATPGKLAVAFNAVDKLVTATETAIAACDALHKVAWSRPFARAIRDADR